MTVDIDVAVVGAGVAGLTLAYRLRRAGYSVRVFEAAGAVGGRMATVRRDGYTIDTGAQHVPTHGHQGTWRLLGQLGYGTEQVPLIGGGLGVWRKERAHAGLADRRGLITGAGLPARGRLELLRFTIQSGLRRSGYDPDHPDRTPLSGITVADLARRYHRDLGQYLFAPLVSGLYGWQPERSAAAPFVALLLASGAPASWRTYRDGMDAFARRIAEETEVHTGTAVRQVVEAPDSARLYTDTGMVTARQAVLCVPAPVARELSANPAEEATRYLSACTYTPMLKVSCLLTRALAPGANLYNLLVPEVEDGVLASIVAGHVKHPNRVPPGCGLLTLSATPRVTRDLLAAPDDQARRLIGRAERYVPGIAEATHTSLVHRFRDGLPEATPNALRERTRFVRRPTGTVEYAGDWVMLRPDGEGAVRSAALAEQRILAHRSHREVPAFAG
jgi:oxygen-dependent protoporphyrinogen oxidase